VGHARLLEQATRVTLTPPLLLVSQESLGGDPVPSVRYLVSLVAGSLKRPAALSVTPAEAETALLGLLGLAPNFSGQGDDCSLKPLTLSADEAYALATAAAEPKNLTLVVVGGDPVGLKAEIDALFAGLISSPAEPGQPRAAASSDRLPLTLPVRDAIHRGTGERSRGKIALAMGVQVSSLPEIALLEAFSIVVAEARFSGLFAALRTGAGLTYDINARTLLGRGLGVVLVECTTAPGRATDVAARLRAELPRVVDLAAAEVQAAKAFLQARQMRLRQRPGEEAAELARILAALPASEVSRLTAGQDGQSPLDSLWAAAIDSVGKEALQVLANAALKDRVSCVWGE